jgi:hypothetical protein
MRPFVFIDIPTRERTGNRKQVEVKGVAMVVLISLGKGDLP